MKRFMSVLAVVAILLATGAPSALAQSDPPQIFLPLMGQDTVEAELPNLPRNQPNGELRPVPNLLEAGLHAASTTEGGGKDPDGAARGAAADLKAVSIIVTYDDSVNLSELEAVSGGQVVHQYRIVFQGASVVLPQDKVDDVAALRGITGVYVDRLLQPATEVSPGFISAPALWNELGGQTNAGEGVVVGVLDTGIWPEHPSFSAPDPLGNAYDPPPVAPGSNGFGAGGPRATCDFGNTAFNSNDAVFTCNNKLIGAYSFLDTYKAVSGLLSTEFDSARDDNGHGTHTASTAAGNAGVAANIFGIPRGVLSGIAPRAHVIAYRVCGDEGCYSSDSAAAVEQAILDEVDTLNFSIGGGGDPYNDIVSLAFLQAYANGVLVAASAGNDGPGPDTTEHREPWTLTVAASTSNRHFLSTVTLAADNGDTLQLTGATVTEGISTPTPVVLPPAGQELCLSPFAPGTFSGKIVVCQRGVIARVEKSFNVAAGGASGLLLYNPALQGLNTDNHFIPSVHLENNSGAELLAFLASHSGVTATFNQGLSTTVPGDVMAPFSFARGGPGQMLGISKPDITAPGVQILAGNTPLPATVEGGLPGELFQSIQGTSMSSPHMAGSAALLKALHPDWSPGQIKSALMMTANTDTLKEDGITPADPFDDGSGRVDLSKAGSPELTISASAADFVALEKELWNANYPSLYLPVMPGQMTVSRTVHNETDKKRTWKLSVSAPPDVTVSVPKHVQVPAHGDASFEITVDARHVPLGEVRHANLELKQGNQTLNFPITLVRRQAVVELEKSCTPLEFAKGATTSCTITLENTSLNDATVDLNDVLPANLELIPGSVSGATPAGNSLHFAGTLFAAAPPLVNVAVDPLASPFGYVPLAGFGPTDAGATDESIANFAVPSFTYAGESYSQIGVVSNGYVVVGGGTGADVSFINSNFPDAALPNNVLAPFWTDLNPEAGGRVLIAVLTDGADVWTVVEWESVENFGDGETNTFQIWIGANTDAHPGEDISFVYGADISDGDSGFLTVGAENKFGNSGASVYFDGVGTLPSPSFPFGSYEVDVFSVPGAPGETHVITFDAKGKKKGAWENCAELTSNQFQGISTACVSGNVNK